ncbi:helix-turn-helix domain-containing protein [Amycolatopsis samaneae]|uniref:Helix-turn-helix domain-containing protein n=2 Tax=Amycolatopsis samaneae TaxID=664691 RepID=A0ABW5GTT2_9PSEU
MRSDPRDPDTPIDPTEPPQAANSHQPHRGGPGGSAPRVRLRGLPCEARSASRVCPIRVGLIEALKNPCYRVRRLLDLAKAWPEQQKLVVDHDTPTRTARQLEVDDIDRLVAAYAKGATVHELAERFGIHRSTVGRHLRARGVDTVPPGLCPADVPAAVELYRSGWTYAQIADKFDVGESTVRDHLHRAGVPKAERYGRTGRNLSKPSR